MPRGARLDAPGALHHVMVRGIERDLLFLDDEDREDFVERMGRLAVDTGTALFAWSLMSNHVHLLLRSGEPGMAVFMRRLLTGYATRFNRRHKRYGHLFQNRYKSILCEEEPYFLRLVSYIHLNPLRAGLVHSLEDLDGYRWSGHGMLMQQCCNRWQDCDTVLKLFSRKVREGVGAYRLFIETESCKGRQPELTGGGLVRSAGGWSEVKSLRKRGEQQFSDERILGSGEFVKEVLSQVEESVKCLVPSVATLPNAIEELLQCCEASGVAVSELQRGSRQREISKIRRDLAVRFVQYYRMSHAECARQLGVSTSAVSRILARRGRKS
ncbi:MAG: hypothetical protein HGB23_01495 [Chlorobiaceae bacterium]|nr:hypothetical protein [Chlorobiaceae bacterium]